MYDTFIVCICLKLDTLFGRPKKYGSAATSSMMGGVGGNGIYSSGSGSTYGIGSRSLPRINSDNDISSGSAGHNDADECEMFVENLDVDALNDKFEEMLVMKIYILKKCPCSVSKFFFVWRLLTGIVFKDLSLIFCIKSRRFLG